MQRLNGITSTCTCSCTFSNPYRRLRSCLWVRVLNVVVLLLLAFGAGAPTVTLAQHAEPSPIMKKLVTAMAGEWTGTATIMNQQGRHQAKSYEKVESTLQNLVLQVHGRHVDATDTTRVVHEAIGMLFYDATTQKLRFVPVTMQSQSVTTWANETDKGMDWGFDIPGGAGKVKYNIDVSTPETWIETGSYSRDGTNWMPIFEMNLKRIRK